MMFGSRSGCWWSRSARWRTYRPRLPCHTETMRVHIGSDHAGFELKSYLVDGLGDRAHELIDHGTTGYDAEDDYPEFCLRTARAVVDDPGSLGVVHGRLRER